MQSFLVIGASGQLGSIIYSDLKASGYQTYGLSRSGPDFFADITNKSDVIQILASLKPDCVINAAAIVSLISCQNDVQLSYSVNAYPSLYLSEFSGLLGYRYVYISTDHYYLDSSNRLHQETDRIDIVNDYAYSKHMGELYALRAPNSVVIRTNITGFRCQQRQSSSTFIEWLINSLSSANPISLYSDFYTSTLDSRTASKAMIRLSLSDLTGIYNIASTDSVSKLEFAKTFANLYGVDLNWHKVASVQELVPQRANTLGLDVSKILSALPGLHLPSHEQVAMNLLNWHNQLNTSNS